MTVWGEGISVWHNMRTGEIETGAPSNWEDIIPQHDAAQSLYRLYREMDMDEMDAAIKVLELIVKVHEDIDA